MKRAVVWLLLVSVLLSVMPAAFAGRVEEFTVETSESGVTVILPAGHAEKGFYKLFWMDNNTGEIKSDVFPVDTPEYRIEAEAGADYRFALFYAKKKGGLPSSWDGDKPNEPEGPSVWKVLWMDARTIEFPEAGIVNTMSEEDFLVSEEAAQRFEALAEDYTGGLVDIQVTRMTLEEPVTEMEYYLEDGYCVVPDSVNADHYAQFTYDSIFVLGRMDGIYVKYNGIARNPDNSMDDPGFSFICLVGDDPADMNGGGIENVCVHEWLHQLGFYYGSFKLEIPDPDHPENYGYDPAPGGTLDPQFFREALTMKSRTEDGRYVGVPAEAWQYKPTHKPKKWDLSHMQNQLVPEELRWQKAEPAETPEPAENPYVPEVTGTLVNEYKYENKTMNLGCVLMDWLFLTGDEYFAGHTLMPLIDPEETAADFTGGLVAEYAESYNAPCNVLFEITYPTESFIAQYDEAAYLEKTKGQLEEGAAKAGLKDFTCEILPYRIGEKTLSGLKTSYLTINGVKVYQVGISWLGGDHLSTVEITAYMVDRIDSIVEKLYWLDP